MRRGVGIVRVSKTAGRDDLISPELQRFAISRYAQSVDIDIVAWREALDESGSQARSPWWKTLDAIITEVERGDFDAVVVWKYNRAARNRLRWAVALDRIEAAGATLESATEGVDTRTSTGRFTRGMLAEMSSFEADRISEGWKEVKARRLRLGLADGQPRFGYDLTEDGYVPNEWAPVLVELYGRKVGGASARWLTRWLAEQGAVTRYGNPYNSQGLVRMLNTGFAAGLVRHGDGWVQGLHPALIDPVLWERYRAQIAQPVQGGSGRYALSGLLVCAYCGKTFHAAHKAGYPNGTLWWCGNRWKVGACDRGSSAWGPKVMRLLDEWLDDLLAGRDEEFQKLLVRKPPKNNRRQLLKVAEDLLVIARKNRQGFYDDETYLRLRGELLDEQRLLLKEQEPAGVVSLSLVRAVRDQQGEDRNEMLRRVVRCVEVRTGVRPKYRIVPLWTVK